MEQLLDPQALGERFETCFGVPNLDAATRYGESFGFRACPRRQLDAGSDSQREGQSGLAKSSRLGHSLLTWHVRDLAAFKTVCVAGGCTEAFTCTTPMDLIGYFYRLKT
jgi:hypothetical protein